MGTVVVDRQKKRDMLWKKAILHFSLCFAMGFFTGFAPSSTTDSVFSTSTITSKDVEATVFPFSSATPHHQVARMESADNAGADRVFNRSLMSHADQLPKEVTSASQSVSIPEGVSVEDDDEEERGYLRQQEQDKKEAAEASDFSGSTDAADEQLLQPELAQRRLVILVTTARPGGSDPLRAASLTRLANTLRLVPSPVLWVVVEPHAGATETAAMLRMTGIMYRHLVYRENFTSSNPAAEVDHQRNLALNHVEHHRLDGVVHFADMANVYDLDFFDHIRAVEAFGIWPVAFVSPKRKKVVVEGPVCRDSQVIGWHRSSVNTTAAAATDAGNSSVTSDTIPRLGVSSFAFNSSILWDPERWGRSSSLSDTSQDSFKFIQETVAEDNTKLLPIPADCNRVMVWRLHIPKALYPAYYEPSSDPQKTSGGIHQPV